MPVSSTMPANDASTVRAGMWSERASPQKGLDETAKREHARRGRRRMTRRDERIDEPTARRGDGRGRQDDVSRRNAGTKHGGSSRTDRMLRH